MTGEATSVSGLRKLSELHVTLRWRDLDAFNHVNNSAFLTFLEEARLVWLVQLDPHWDIADIAPILAATQLNYRRQLNWPDSVIVELFCQRVGKTSLTIAHKIVAATDRSRVYLDGDVVMVWIDRKTSRPVPLPPAIRAACG